jgi:membrane fusion protein (multidrug efflux system)
VAVLAGAPTEVVTVPRTAVTYSLYGDSVYVVNSGNVHEAVAALPKAESPVFTVERRFVKTGQVQEDRVAITTGLKAGEEVVTTGQIKLNPGASIRIDNTQPLSRTGERPRQ